MTTDMMFGELDIEARLNDFEEENRKLRRENECLLRKNKRLTAFIVEQRLAIEYIEWKRKVMTFE